VSVAVVTTLPNSHSGAASGGALSRGLSGERTLSDGVGSEPEVGVSDVSVTVGVGVPAQVDARVFPAGKRTKRSGVAVRSGSAEVAAEGLEVKRWRECRERWWW
jgi:hypothetical protein